MPKRVAISLFILLLLAHLLHYVYALDDEIRYTIFSNGTHALIKTEIAHYSITCGMVDCWPEVYSVDSYLFYYDPPHIYLLNLIPAARILINSSLPHYFPRNTTTYIDVWAHWVAYLNNSWYVNVSVHAYFPELNEGRNYEYTYLLDTKNFCVRLVNLDIHSFPSENMKRTINGWSIEIPKIFKTNKTSIPIWANLLVAYSNISAYYEDEKLIYMPPPSEILVVNSSIFPIYFILKKGEETKNVTLLYININNKNPPRKRIIFQLPENIRIINVTLCNQQVSTNTSTPTPTETPPKENTTMKNIKITNTSTETLTPKDITTSPPVKNITTRRTNTTTSPTTTKGSICGPGLIILLAIFLVIKRKI
ncbi:hypothetical protein PNA2_0934 [Pyrococcus sp. NA2]|uniref:CGP-CTERM sorting domain-containing protein n=1 Tax=Pyrococcus sp. (strain NA2) TaxID=342949 RepID=UPI000209A90D|nr:CGP-CTERM sorting domain-containing protein [Pyrococcus sp. NA2]AEC51850.1 hypothetical protein PNA2_0934 [Pyrococcus sp. NA2]